MCGIAGLVLKREGRVRRSDLVAMADALAHRGPDADGVWAGTGQDSHVGLAHRRLSVLDLEGGAQPMSSADGRVVVVFNGQIYNHLALRAELEQKGHRFLSDHSDTEVLVNGYREWGADLCKRLNGQFAFAAVDRDRRTVLLARDPMGQKPLYVASPAFFDAGFGGATPRIAFASELSALALLPGARRRISPLAFSRYLALDFVPDPDCIYDGVHKVAPGMLIELSLDDDDALPGRGRYRHYWDLSFDAVHAPRRERAQREAVLDVLNEAVRTRLVADVPVGVFLSGGIDSSLIAALARRHTSQLRTFSIGFREKSFDESSHARRMADHLGTEHHEELLDAGVMRDVLPTIADHLSEPFADHSVVPTFLLSRFAQRHVTVALGGDGGDELFLGYPTFQVERARPALLDRAAGWTTGPRDMLLALAGRLPVSHDNLSLDFKLRQTLLGVTEPHPMLRHQAFLTGMSIDALASLLDDDLPPSLPRQAFDALTDLEADAHRVGARDVWDTLTYGYAKTYLAAGVMQKVDRASMAVGLETRAPMLDKRFVELALAISGRDKVRGLTTKAALKRAARGLVPDEIINRPKKGFGMPVASWLAGPLRPMLEDVLFSREVMGDGLLDPRAVRCLVDEHLTKKRNHRKTLWALFMYGWWRTRVHGRAHANANPSSANPSSANPSSAPTGTRGAA